MSSAELPLGMRTVLRTIAWRRFALRLGSLVATVIAGTAATVLVWLTIDAFWNLPPAVRATGQFAAVAVFITLFGWGIRRLFFDPVNDTQLARSIDRAYPELQERFTTCFDLLQQPTPRTRMGRWFRSQLKRETFPQLEAIHSERVISDRGATWATIFLMLLIVLAVVPRVWWGAGYAHLWSRWERPWENLGWGRLAAISISPRDGFAIRDRDFPITATLTHFRSDAESAPPLTLHWRTLGDRVWQTRPLPAHESGEYTGVIPHVPRDVEWYVTGPAVESPHAITRVMDPPQIVALTAVIDPPGYTRHASRQTSVVGDLAVLAGSRVRLSIISDQPLRDAELVWPDSESPTSHTIALTNRGTHGTVDVVATVSGAFSFRMTTPEGLILEEPPRSLSVRPDQPPVVKLMGAASLSLRPDDRHEITAHADDDFGLSTAELYIEIGGRKQEPISLRLPGERATAADVSHTIDLLPWNLAAGTSVLLRIRVLDNREQPGPQEGWSAPQVIVISNSAISAAERRLADNTRQSRNELGEIIKQLEEERAKLRDIHQKTAAATVRQKQAEQNERLKELTEAHQDLQQRLADFAAMLPDDEPGEALRQQTEEVANGPLESAAKKLEATPKLEPRDQIPTLSQALDDLAAAKKALQKIDDALIARNALGDDLQMLQQLANRSDRIAEDVEEAGDATASREAAEAVQKIQDELAQVVKRRPEWQAAMKQAERAEQATQQQTEMDATAKAEQPASALNPENMPSPSAEKQTTAESGSPMPNGQPAPSNDKMSPLSATTGPVPAEAGAELSKAQQQLAEAQASLASEPPENADGPPAMVALQEAARALRAAVERTAGPASQPEPGPPQTPRDSDVGRGQQMAGQPGEAGATGEETALTDFPSRNIKGTSQRNWGRLPTGLKTEILQGSKRPAHTDYARQVQRYFERIAQPAAPVESEATP